MKEIEFKSATFYVGQNCLENDELFRAVRFLNGHFFLG